MDQRSNFVRFARGLRAGLGFISILLQVATLTWMLFAGTTKNIHVEGTGTIVLAVLYIVLSFLTASTQVFMKKWWQLSFSAAILGGILAYSITRGAGITFEGFNFEGLENAFGIVMVLAWIYGGLFYFLVDGILVIGYRFVKWVINR